LKAPTHSHVQHPSNSKLINWCKHQESGNQWAPRLSYFKVKPAFLPEGRWGNSIPKILWGWSIPQIYQSINQCYTCREPCRGSLKYRPKRRDPLERVSELPRSRASNSGISRNHWASMAINCCDPHSAQWVNAEQFLSVREFTTKEPQNWKTQAVSFLGRHLSMASS
jgi:hypothetical protein